ncbi:MAG: hypothetical protein WAW63_00975 [Candidatus Saccharimonadales bacterium]|nr:hypothetical protein [Candidatus Saccharibacteria bacterium]
MTKLEDVEPVIEGAARDHAGIGRTVMPHTDVDYLALEREGMDGMRTYAIMEVPAMSYGNPESNISYIKKIESGLFKPEVISFAERLISSGECMRDITEEDDGCIDGREAVMAAYTSVVGGELVTVEEPVKPGNHIRPKVAGGGYITGLAMKCALDSHTDSVDVELGEVAEKLDNEGVHCGTHTGMHSGHERTDCGANDKLEDVFHTAIDQFAQIAQSVRGGLDIAGLPYDDVTMEYVYSGWSGTAEHEAYFSGSTGESRFNIIMSHIAKVQEASGKNYPISTSKHLNGNHNEAFIVLNFASGSTFSQEVFRARLREEFPDMTDEDLPQAFVVDVPRLVQLSRTIAKGHTDRTGNDDEEKSQKVALYAGIAYQFATAATLTDGTLRTFVVSEDAA